MRSKWSLGWADKKVLWRTIGDGLKTWWINSDRQILTAHIHTRIGYTYMHRIYTQYFDTLFSPCLTFRVAYPTTVFFAFQGDLDDASQTETWAWNLDLTFPESSCWWLCHGISETKGHRGLDTNEKRETERGNQNRRPIHSLRRGCMTSWDRNSLW